MPENLFCVILDLLSFVKAIDQLDEGESDEIYSITFVIRPNFGLDYEVEDIFEDNYYEYREPGYGDEKRAYFAHNLGINVQD